MSARAIARLLVATSLLGNVGIALMVCTGFDSIYGHHGGRALQIIFATSCFVALVGISVDIWTTGSLARMVLDKEEVDAADRD